jgi:hypothetical protein
MPDRESDGLDFFLPETLARIVPANALWIHRTEVSLF